MIVYILSQLTPPIPDDFGNRLWEHGPLTYMLVVAVMGLTGALIYMFKKYDQSNVERRADDLQTLEVLKGVTVILDSVGKKAGENLDVVIKEIESTKTLIRERTDDIKSNMKR